MLRIAHRGLPRRARENTLPGFALALDLGADGIELDVHATRDGVVVVHHDAALARGPAIESLTYAELQRHEAAPGVPIPSLAQVCELVAGRAILFVEIKGAGIEQRVAETLAPYRGEVAIHSFDHAMIARLHRAGYPHPLGVLFDERIEEAAEVMEATGATDVWPHHSLVTAALAALVHSRGGRLITWTVNDAATARAMVAAGVDGLCGDDVTLFP